MYPFNAQTLVTEKLKIYHTALNFCGQTLLDPCCSLVQRLTIQYILITGVIYGTKPYTILSYICTY